MIASGKSEHSFTGRTDKGFVLLIQIYELFSEVGGKKDFPLGENDTALKSAKGEFTIAKFLAAF